MMKSIAVALLSLDAVYVLTGLVLWGFAGMTFRDRANKRRRSSGSFWLILGTIFVFGSFLRYWVTGLLVLAMVVIDGTGGVSRGSYNESSKAEQTEHARRLGGRIFIPVLLIPIVTFGFALAFRAVGWLVPPGYLQELTHLDATRAALVGLGLGGVVELRERVGRLEIEEAEIRLRLEQAIENVRREFDCEPGLAIAAEMPEVPDGVTLSARARELERELRLMGPINPLALSEYEALVERHEFLQQQLDDVRNTRRELTRVIKAADEEIVIVFDSAFADVARHFSELFAMLFPGGSGRVVLTDPHDLLNTGIEIEARPSGKTVRRLSLLSGGERPLAALAYLFAVFRARPSPFYLMDEVEAALDDVNLHRFLDLVHEFRDEAQLLVVSHQKRTMEAADCLYGVSMPPGGSSRVVSQRVNNDLPVA